MKIWLTDSKSKTECGINNDGNLFLGNESSGYNLEDTEENREYIINDFRRYVDMKFVNTDNEKDIVTLDEISKRYIEINGGYNGFIEYVINGFKDNVGMVEYEVL